MPSNQLVVIGKRSSLTLTIGLEVYPSIEWKEDNLDDEHIGKITEIVDERINEALAHIEHDLRDRNL